MNGPGALISKMDFSDRSMAWGRVSAEDLTGFREAIRQATRADQRRIERAIRGAIRAGYDGVDINRPNPVDGVGIVSIEPWQRPAPDSANGYRTERYTWDWFSDDELTRLLRADSLDEVLRE